MDKQTRRRTRRGGIKCMKNGTSETYSNWWSCNTGDQPIQPTEEDCSKLSFYQKWGKKCKPERQNAVDSTELPDCSFWNGYGRIKPCKSTVSNPIKTETNDYSRNEDPPPYSYPRGPPPPYTPTLRDSFEEDSDTYKFEGGYKRKRSRRRSRRQRSRRR